VGKDKEESNAGLEEIVGNGSETDNLKKQTAASGEEPQAGAATAEPSAEEALTEPGDPVLLRQALAEQTIRAEEYFERLARLQADFDNFRRRTRQEKEEFYKYASERLISALLPVLDNFERALVAESGSIDSLKSGVQMIFRQLQEALAAEGLTPVPSVGGQFDPQKHEAALRDESGDHPDNTILEELRRGYYLKDKVIRPAMVKVAKSF
jgi:molecular chaperone GrpE